jgi:hypothetical protein
MNQNENVAVEVEEVELSTMTMQEIVNAAIERGFKPRNKTNCFYHWNYSDEQEAYRFMLQYDKNSN